MEKKYKAALFDLDGVVFDTEPQYTIFWGRECRRYHPEIPGLELMIKGKTLKQIFEGHFSEFESEWANITNRLFEFEGRMNYVFVDGFENFLNDVRKQGIKTAIVTSSNIKKMENVYRQHPYLTTWFDAILTAEDFDRSKPDPDCYLKGAARLNADIHDCIVFEDSFNGLISGKDSGAKVVGLSTSNPEEKIKHLCNYVISDYTNTSCEEIITNL